VKRHSYLIFTTLLVVASVGGYASAATPPVTALPARAGNASASWESSSRKDVEQPMPIAAFLDESFGLTGGPADVGRAYVTTDGGETWTMADSSAA